MSKQRVLAMHGEPDASCLQSPSCTAFSLFDISDVRDGGARQEKGGYRTGDMDEAVYCSRDAVKLLL